MGCTATKAVAAAAEKEEMSLTQTELRAGVALESAPPTELSKLTLDGEVWCVRVRACICVRACGACACCVYARVRCIVSDIQPQRQRLRQH